MSSHAITSPIPPTPPLAQRHICAPDSLVIFPSPEFQGRAWGEGRGPARPSGFPTASPPRGDVLHCAAGEMKLEDEVPCAVVTVSFPFWGQIRMSHKLVLVNEFIWKTATRARHGSKVAGVVTHWSFRPSRTSTLSPPCYSPT